MKKVLLKDVVAHLLTLPQNLEVFELWDEGGYYFPAQTHRLGCVQRVKFKSLGGTSRTKWREDNGGRKVVVLMEDIGESLARYKAEAKAKKGK